MYKQVFIFLAFDGISVQRMSNENSDISGSKSDNKVSKFIISI